MLIVVFSDHECENIIAKLGQIALGAAYKGSPTRDYQSDYGSVSNIIIIIGHIIAQSFFKASTLLLG